MSRVTILMMVTGVVISFGSAFGATGDDALEQATALLRAGDHETAADEFRAILGADPTRREARLGLARALSFAGDLEGGESEYRLVITEHPDDVEARLGLADVLAWQGRHEETEAILSVLAEERPADPEVWMRRGKLALWSGRTDDAKQFFTEVLRLDPENPEVRRQLESLSPRRKNRWPREIEMGVSVLQMRLGDPGSSVWSAVRDRSVMGWEFLIRAERLDRYARQETQATAGFLRRAFGRGHVRVEGSVSPGAEIFPQVMFDSEVGWSLTAGISGYLGARFTDYAAVDLWTGATGFEYYLPGRTIVFARYTLVRTQFAGGGTSHDGAWTAKLTRFFTGPNRAWLFVSQGAEAYRRGTADEIGDISSYAIGMGGRFFPSPRWSLEPGFEWQEREGGNRFVTLAAAVHYRF